MMDAGSFSATRDSYDAVAEAYAEALAGELDGLPIDRALLSAFAELVQGTGNRRVADVGCGPGRVTIRLSRLGLDPVGIDLSPGMVALATRTYPSLRFVQGSMLALDLADASLGGLLAYYSIIHVPWERRSQVFAEFHRVLAPGGVVMRGFQVGNDRGRTTEFFGKAVSVDWYRQQPTEVAELLCEAGFEPLMTAVREPVGTEKTPQGCVMARRPA
jgi:ubiquinone/menaquinone biosynthesis C-methylase UbiE